MPVTYEILASTTISGSPTTVTISSIPQSYTDLRLVCNFNVATVSGIGFRLNGQAGVNYTFENLFFGTGNNGEAAIAAGDSQFSLTWAAGQRTNSVAIATLDIFQYASTVMKKSVLWDKAYQNNTTASNENQRIMACGLFDPTTAITSVTLNNSSSNPFTNGGTVTLFGILRA